MSSFERCIVLVVDDEPTVLKTVTYVLERHGYIVIPAPDGLTALCACLERGGPVHLAVLDITIPSISGLDSFNCLLEFHPKIEACSWRNTLQSTSGNMHRCSKRRISSPSLFSREISSSV